MKLSARQQAKLQGETTYYSGACVHGHDARKYTYNGGCVTCLKVYRTKYYQVKSLDPVFRKANTARLAKHKTEAKAKDPLRYKARQKIKARKYHTGMTEDQYLYFLKVQDNRCALCLRNFTDARTPRADHCHDTGKVRGLLCNSCNAAEGFIKDTGIEPIMWANRLVDYLSA